MLVAKNTPTDEQQQLLSDLFNQLDALMLQIAAKMTDFAPAVLCELRYVLYFEFKALINQLATSASESINWHAILQKVNAGEFAPDSITANLASDTQSEVMLHRLALLKQDVFAIMHAPSEAMRDEAVKAKVVDTLDTMIDAILVNVPHIPQRPSALSTLWLSPQRWAYRYWQNKVKQELHTIFKLQVDFGEKYLQFTPEQRQAYLKCDKLGQIDAAQLAFIYRRMVVAADTRNSQRSTTAIAHMSPYAIAALAEFEVAFAIRMDMPSVTDGYTVATTMTVASHWSTLLTEGLKQTRTHFQRIKYTMGEFVAKAFGLMVYLETLISYCIASAKLGVLAIPALILMPLSTWRSNYNLAHDTLPVWMVRGMRAYTTYIDDDTGEVHQIKKWQWLVLFMLALIFLLVAYSFYAVFAAFIEKLPFAIRHFGQAELASAFTNPANLWLGQTSLALGMLGGVFIFFYMGWLAVELLAGFILRSENPFAGLLDSFFDVERDDFFAAVPEDQRQQALLKANRIAKGLFVFALLMALGSLAGYYFLGYAGSKLLLLVLGVTSSSAAKILQVCILTFVLVDVFYALRAAKNFATAAAGRYIYLQYTPNPEPLPFKTKLALFASAISAISVGVLIASSMFGFYSVGIIILIGGATAGMSFLNTLVKEFTKIGGSVDTRLSEQMSDTQRITELLTTTQQSSATNQAVSYGLVRALQRLPDLTLEEEETLTALDPGQGGFARGLQVTQAQQVFNQDWVVQRQASGNDPALVSAIHGYAQRLISAREYPITRDYGQRVVSASTRFWQAQQLFMAVTPRQHSARADHGLTW